MVRKLRNLLAVLWLISSSLYAQSAVDALRAASARFKALHAYSATIGFTMGEERDMGEVYYAGDQYRLDFPEDQTICDGKAVMNYAKGFGAVSVTEPTTAADYSLGGIYELYRFGYDFAWADTMFAVQHMQLTALDDALSAFQIQIGIAKKTGLISEFSIAFRNDLRIAYVVIEEQLDPVLPADWFKIDWEFVKRAENGEIAPIEHHH